MTVVHIKNIDKVTWQRFVGLCKINGVGVGDEINALLKDYFEKNKP